MIRGADPPPITGTTTPGSRSSKPPYLPSIEVAIDRALTKLSAGRFQRLAEAYAELRWPKRYVDLVPQGRTPFDATATGWPDAWAIDVAGRLHATEATLQKAWTEHLDADIARLETYDRLGSFVFVCAARQPRKTTLATRQTKLRALGLNAANTHLVFRQQLCRELSGPRFARIRADLLGLPPTPAPFVAVEVARALYADGSANAFAPTRAEYAEPNRVWRNTALGAVRERLTEQGWTFVEGHGAAGKTVLCTQIALERLRLLLPAYYVDLARADVREPRSAIGAMVTYGGEGVLFVVDNVHLAPHFVGAVFDDWRTRADGSLLLLSGRRVSADPWDGIGDPIADLRVEAVALKPTPEDVREIYRRLARRIEPDPPTPSRFLTRRWTELFRGDLVALAAALAAAQEPGRLVRDLSPGDAYDYMRETYLAPYLDNPAGRQAIIAVAALGTLEITAPASVVDVSRLAPSLQSGTVLRFDDGVTVAHAGLARLILAAAGRQIPDVETLVRCATADPALGAVIARRLREQRAYPASTALWRALLSGQDWTRFLPSSLDDFPRIIEALRQAVGTLTWDEIDTAIGERMEWSSAATAGSLHSLCLTIALCGTRMPRCAAELERSVFPEGQAVPWLRSRLVDAHPRSINRLRRVTNRFHPTIRWEDAVVEDVSATIDEIEWRLRDDGVRTSATRTIAALLEHSPQTAAALDARIGKLDVDTWVTIAAHSNPKRLEWLSRQAPLPTTRRRIAQALDEEELPRRVIEAALARGSHELTERIFRLQASLPALYLRVAEELAARGDADAWAERALNRVSGSRRGEVGRWLGQALALSLALPPIARPFLERADAALTTVTRSSHLERAVRVQTTELLGRSIREAPRNWPRVNARLVELADEPEVVASLARELFNCSLSGLRLMFVEHPLAHAVIAAVEAEAWEAGRPVLEAGKSFHHFPAVAAGLARFGRRDLAEPLAIRLAQALVAREIPIRRIKATHASHLMRLVPRERGELRASLAALLAGNDWLAQALQRTSVSELGQTIYSLACFAPELSETLAQADVSERLTWALAAGREAQAIRLIGALSLVQSVHRGTLVQLNPIGVGAVLDDARWRNVDHLPPGLVQALLAVRVARDAGIELPLPMALGQTLHGRCARTRRQSPRQHELLDELQTWLADIGNLAST